MNTFNNTGHIGIVIKQYILTKEQAGDEFGTRRLGERQKYFQMFGGWCRLQKTAAGPSGVYRHDGSQHVKKREGVMNMQES